MTEYPVIIHPGTPITFRARWCHPNGSRLGLVGHFLYRAGVTGPWRRGGEYTTVAADRFARRRGFRHAACQNHGVAIETGRHPLPKANIDSAVNFKNLIRNESRRDRPLVFGFGDLLLESTPTALPVSSLLDGTPGDRGRYLRQLAKHRRRVRKAGWIHPPSHAVLATVADEKRRLYRRKAKERAVKMTASKS